MTGFCCLFVAIVACACLIAQYTVVVTLQALSSTTTNHHSCFAWSYKALAILVDCMWSFGWRLEGGAERTVTRRAICLIISYRGSLINRAIIC